MREFLRSRVRRLTSASRGMLAFVLLGFLTGCADLAGMGADGRVKESAVIPKQPSYHMEESVLKWRDKDGKDREMRRLVQVEDPSPPQPAVSPEMPAHGAWVAVMWRYNGSVSDVCVHGVVLRTDATGMFHASGWVDPLNFNIAFYPWRRYQQFLVYKPGFAIAHTNQDDIRPAADGLPVIVLHPYTEGLERRLFEVSAFIDTLKCNGSNSDSWPTPRMRPFLLAMLDEARALANSDPEKIRQIEELRIRIQPRPEQPMRIMLYQQRGISAVAPAAMPVSPAR